jgi:hypothetical protein
MNDPSIAAFDPNGCLYIDSPKPSPYYLSPNVIMTTKPADPSDVYPGNNTTSVSVSWKASCTIPNELAVIFDLYIGDPTLPMIPGSTLGPLATAYPPPNGVNINAGQSNVVTTVGPWNSSAIPHLSQPHHACLLARVYPFGATPDTGDLSGYPSSDQHYAQHNCTVNTSDGQGMIKIPIRNGTLAEEPVHVSIQAVPELEPSRVTLDAVLPSLRLIPAFKQVATTPLKRIQLDTTAFRLPVEAQVPRIQETAAIARERTAIFEDVEANTLKLGGTPARVILPPKLFTTFDFTADITGAKIGDAHIYHVTQVNAKGQPYGGLTVVIVVT